MKTNITMLSDSDRNLYGITIRQNTKDCMLNLSDLQSAYEIARAQYGWTDKEVQNIINYDQNIERIFFVLNEQGLLPTGKNTLTCFYEQAKEQGIVRVLKELGVYKTTGRGENRTVYCNPYIWVLIAMEMNPQIYGKVVIWLTDKLIFNRIEAGDYQLSLNSIIKAYIPDPDYPTIAMECNKRIFGRHEAKIRNTRSQDELKELSRLEDNIAFGIRKGFYKTNEDIIEAIRTY